ncbi:hypothetical protein FACS189483_07640 [Spirochaetia bacterium]|nr:hypothetical protein FACS189483_07640 [Spirochaetia bacterium]
MGLLSKAAAHPSHLAASPMLQREEAKSPSPEQAVWDAVAAYAAAQNEFQGILLNPPPNTRGTVIDDHFVQLSTMIGSFALVVRLPSDNALALIPKAKDRGLIAHRLGKSLRTAPPDSFEAADLDQAITRIIPYL